MLKKSFSVLNELLVETFNDILEIEQKTLKEGVFNDLSITEMHTIEAIGMYESRAMSEVAKELDITVGTLTTAINNLVRKEYVQRKRDEKDRRVVKIALTRKGKLAYRVHEKFHSNMVKATIEGLTEEEEEILIRSLDKLNKFFNKKYNLEENK
ncbi:MarR family winged helix-turn-helix transcriptional regulator [Haloimpatiens sp. FM7330]|uniref:MarR family winged helix-turn-helix transcriptional regulator n=1 Tax=Haloimpatiens sp. FM7330 TaxID=3298610 RepID=UPI00363941E8